MKHILLIILLGACLEVAAQYTTVVFNYEKSQFNDGQPLPSETTFIIQGEAKGDVDMVEVLIIKSGLSEDNYLYKGSWVREYNNQSEKFIVPVNYKLRQNQEFDIKIKYYVVLSPDLRQHLATQLYDQLLNYLDQEIVIKPSQIKLRHSAQLVKSNLDQIVIGALGNTRNRINRDFQGFSDIVNINLRYLDGLSLNQAAKFLIPRRDRANTNKAAHANEHIEKLRKQVINEVSQFLNMDMLILDETKVISAYSTEKKLTKVQVNIGYGGIYNDSDQTDDFGDGLYAGLAFPLGHKAFTAPFWSNISVNAGIFLQDIDFGNDQKYTGPIFSKPSYVGIGYKILHIVRVNAGAVFLQQRSGNSDLLEISEVSVKPFVGVSAELKLWLGTD